MIIWVNVFKNVPSKISGKQPLKYLKWYGLLTISFQFLKGFFYKFYLVHSWIPGPICLWFLSLLTEFSETFEKFTGKHLNSCFCLKSKDMESLLSNIQFQLTILQAWWVITNELAKIIVSFRSQLTTWCSAQPFT